MDHPLAGAAEGAKVLDTDASWNQPSRQSIESIWPSPRPSHCEWNCVTHETWHSIARGRPTAEKKQTQKNPKWDTVHPIKIPFLQILYFVHSILYCFRLVPHRSSNSNQGPPLQYQKYKISLCQEIEKKLLGIFWRQLLYNIVIGLEKSWLERTHDA